MREITEELLAALQYKALLARITLDDGQVLQNDPSPEGLEPIQRIVFQDGSDETSGAVTVGSTVAASVTVYLEKSQVDHVFADRVLHIEMGMDLDGEEQWFDMGDYTVTDVQNDDDTVTVVAMDRMVSDLDTEFEEFEGLDFDSADGVSAKAFLQAVCLRFGLTVDLDGLEDHVLKDFSPEGCTYRQLIGFVAAMYGKFARIGRSGHLQLAWYRNVDVLITPDDYYEDGLQKGSYDFVVSWVKCYNEALEETLTEGNEEADQGIYFSCPWMNYDLLASLWKNLEGFHYAPVSELRFFGDPRLELGDAPRLLCLDGNIYRVPIMGITQEWDGGLMTSITSIGQLKSSSMEGPVQRESKRAVAKILKRTDGIEMSVESAQNEISHLQLRADEIEAAVADTQGNISELQQSAGEIVAKVDGALGDVAQMQILADEVSTTVEGLSKEVTEIKQTSKEVNVQATDETGTLETKITPVAWVAEHRDADGNVTSSFHFDFGLGQFVFNGTGSFMAPDGKSRITVDGGAFVLSTKDQYEDWASIAKIGYSEDSEGNDYPYMLLGSALETAREKNLGLIKAFSNGIYVGNAIPKLSTGEFAGMPGAAGFFINTYMGQTFTVVGETLYDSFTALFG